jgi:transposase
MGAYSKVSDEYKAQAVELIRRDGWTYREVAQAADVSISAVRLWVNKADKENPETGKPPSREELERQNRALAKENKQLRMERDFAKKVAAWFAKDENRRDLWR